MRSFILFVFLFSLLLTGCEKDTVDKPLTFAEQQLQGEVNGESWKIVDGRVTLIDDNFQVELLAETDTNICLLDSIENNYLIFNIPDNDTGTYTLLKEGPLVTFVEVSNNIANNQQLFMGTLDIQTIDTTVNMEITGRLLVNQSSESILNGNFTASFCN